MKAYWGSGSMAPFILSLRHCMEVSGQLHASAALPQGKSPWYPLNRRVGGPQSRSGRGVEERKTSHKTVIMKVSDFSCVSDRYSGMYLLN
jgi:hypothetical protein